MVRGGKGDQLVVGGHGVVAGLADVAGHRVAVDAHEPLGLTDTAAVGDVLQEGDGLLPAQMRVEQRRALAFGEPIAAGAATEKANRGRLAVVAANGEVSPTTHAMIGAVGIQAAEPSEVVDGPPPSTYPLR